VVRLKFEFLNDAVLLEAFAEKTHVYGYGHPDFVPVVDLHAVVGIDGTVAGETYVQTVGSVGITWEQTHPTKDGNGGGGDVFYIFDAKKRREIFSVFIEGIQIRNEGFFLVASGDSFEQDGMNGIHFTAFEGIIGIISITEYLEIDVALGALDHGNDFVIECNTGVVFPVAGSEAEEKKTGAKQEQVFHKSVFHWLEIYVVKTKG